MSVRSSLSAGVAAAVLAAGAGVAVVSPVAAAPLPVTASPAVQLSALAVSLPKPTKPLTNPFGGATGATPGERIINGYNAIEPWVQYSVELGAWGVGWLPWPIGLIAPQMNIGYSAVEPLSRAAVYSVAYAIDGQPELIQPTIRNGIQTSVNNLVQGEISWIASFFPPLPPIGGGAAIVAPRVAARAAASSPKPVVSAVKAGAAAATVDDVPSPAPAKLARVKAAAATPVVSPAPVGEASSEAPEPAAAAQPDASQSHTSRSAKSTRSTPKAGPRAASSAKAGRGQR